ncbi:MAG: hypothetical protein ACJ760_05885, partial [Thermoleophilaceae bacterium]
AAAATSDDSARREIRYSRSGGRLDEAGWRAVVSELAVLEERLGVIFADSDARLLASGEQGDDATVMIVQFVAPDVPSHLLQVGPERHQTPPQTPNPAAAPASPR